MDRPTVALMYDFDGTLSPSYMQEYDFMDAIGLTDKESFWKASHGLAEKQQSSTILAYMKLMVDKAQENGISIRRQQFVEFGRGIGFFPGVEQWFDLINRKGAEMGVNVEHYIISSGMKEIIEGSSIKDCFKSIFACEFLYDENGAAVWPKTDVNYTNKTQFVYRINKGVLDVANDVDLNRSMPDDSKRVPFCNMIYIGDGLSDVPCMKMMKAYGGYSIAVYQKRDSKVEALLNRDRVDFIYPADYSDGTGLDMTVKNIIKKMAIADKLTAENSSQKKNI